VNRRIQHLPARVARRVACHNKPHKEKGRSFTHKMGDDPLGKD
jgi:hypothetical protein